MTATVSEGFMQLRSTRIGDEVRLPEASQPVLPMGKLDLKPGVPSVFLCQAPSEFDPRGNTGNMRGVFFADGFRRRQ